jgi:hypothetical protein
MSTKKTSWASSLTSEHKCASQESATPSGAATAGHVASAGRREWYKTMEVEVPAGFAIPTAQELPFQLTHAARRAGAVVVMPKEMAEPMHGEALQLFAQASPARATAGGLHRDHDVAEKDPVTRRISHAAEFLHLKAQHVGGAVELAKCAVEPADLVVVGEQQAG